MTTMSRELDLNVENMGAWSRRRTVHMGFAENHEDLLDGRREFLSSFRKVI